MSDNTRRPLHAQTGAKLVPSGRTPAAAHSIACANRSDNSEWQSHRFGGARRDRTDDLMLAKHALSQLSYGPFRRQDRLEPFPGTGLLTCSIDCLLMVGLGGLEPPTSRLSSARSNQLSYKPGRKAAHRQRGQHPQLPVLCRPITVLSIRLVQEERET